MILKPFAGGSPDDHHILLANAAMQKQLGVSAEQIIDEISKKSGTLYDHDAIDACVELFRQDGFTFEQASAAQGS